MNMKKSHARHTAKKVRAVKHRGDQKSFLVLLKSWMFVVMFALMLGIGAIIGTYLNQQITISTPEVAGVSIEK